MDEGQLIERLRWDEIEFDRNAIVRRPSKTARRSDKPVVVPIHPDLLGRLLAVKPEPAKGFVCPCKAEQYRRNKVAAIHPRRRGNQAAGSGGAVLPRGIWPG